MTKARITTIRRAGRILLVTGHITCVIGLGLLLAFGGHLTTAPGGGHAFVPRLNGVYWTTMSVTLAAGVVLLAGLALQLVAWIGALIATYRLADKAWFAVLLVGGLLGLLFGPIRSVVMWAYRIAGPDGTPVLHHERTQMAEPRPAKLPSGH